MTAASGTARRSAFRILTVLFGVASFGGLFGVGIVIGWYDTTEGGIHRVHDLGFGILFGVILTTAFLALARRPETKPSVFLQVVAVAAASLLAGAVALAVGYVVIGIVVAVAAAILLALHPDRTGVLHPAARPSPVLGALAVVGSVPLIWYAVITAGLQRDGLPGDPHVEQGHWVTMSAMGSSRPLWTSPTVLPAKCSATISLLALTIADPESPWSEKNSVPPAFTPAFGLGLTTITLFRVFPAIVLLVLSASTIPPVSPVRMPRLRTW